MKNRVIFYWEQINGIKKSVNIRNFSFNNFDINENFIYIIDLFNVATYFIDEPFMYKYMGKLMDLHTF